MRNNARSTKEYIGEGMSDFFGDMFGTMGMGPRKGKVDMIYPFESHPYGRGNRGRGIFGRGPYGRGSYGRGVYGRGVFRNREE